MAIRVHGQSGRQCGVAASWATVVRTCAMVLTAVGHRRCDFSSRPFLIRILRAPVVPVAVLGALLAAAGPGCNGQDRADARVTQIQELRDKVEQQGRAIAQKDEQLAAQGRRIQELQGLTAEQSIENLVRVDRIEIERLSGGYDEDHDGVDEGVVVYLRLLDKEGDAIKAAGSANLQLLDLSRAEGPRTVGEVRLDPAALRPMWFGRLMTYHYTIRIPWSGGAARPSSKSVTVRVEFTELLSGKTFEAQAVVEVSGTTAS